MDCEQKPARDSSTNVYAAASRLGQHFAWAFAVGKGGKRLLKQTWAFGNLLSRCKGAKCASKLTENFAKRAVRLFCITSNAHILCDQKFNLERWLLETIFADATIVLMPISDKQWLAVGRLNKTARNSELHWRKADFQSASARSLFAIAEIIGLILVYIRNLAALRCLLHFLFLKIKHL